MSLPMWSHLDNSSPFGAGLYALHSWPNRQTALLKDGNCLRLCSPAKDPEMRVLKKCFQGRPKRSGQISRKRRRWSTYAISVSPGGDDLGLAHRRALEYRFPQSGARELGYWCSCTHQSFVRAAAGDTRFSDNSCSAYSGRGVYTQQPQEISMVVTFVLLARKTEAQGHYVNCTWPQGQEWGRQNVTPEVS